MSIFILSIILVREKDKSLLLLTEILVFVCLLFFISSNFLIVYIFFELSLIPILVMILGFGSQIEKINSSYYLLFYAAICSFPFLFIYFYSNFFLTIVYFDFFLSWEFLFILSLTFMIKFPVYFLHLWLPKAHVEAPTSASIILAGLLLKLGTAGFLRILGSFNFSHNNIWIIIAFLGMIIGAFACVFQSDAKALAAYSSITHMGFLLLSLLFLRISGKSSGLLLILAHGYTSTLIFYLIGEFYHSTNTRLIYFFNSFFASNIFFSIVIAFVFLSNMGVPPSASFISEFIIISNGILYNNFLFFLVFVYFIVAFYYSLFFIACSFVGKSFFHLEIFGAGLTYFISIMIFNIF